MFHTINDPAAQICVDQQRWLFFFRLLSCRVQELCSALTYSAQKKNPDESIQSGVRWLLRMICAMWSQLDDRVRTDVERKARNDRREKAERAKRVQRNRQLRLFQLMRY